MYYLSTNLFVLAVFLGNSRVSGVQHEDQGALRKCRWQVTARRPVLLPGTVAV